MPALDVLIPTFTRSPALAVELSSLNAQTFSDFRIVISDQTENGDASDAPEVQAVLRVLLAHGIAVEVYKNLPRQGMAHQRQFLLDKATAPCVLYLDDDLILEPYVVGRMLTALREERCGFVGMAVHGLTLVNDYRPEQEAIEFWDGPVRPEQILPDTPEWERYKLHSAANLYHLQQRLGLPPEAQRKYKVAWVGGCTMYDTAKLRASGGFAFWRALPPIHCGEDVVAQQRVMARFGGCGLLPSGVFHQELVTTLPDRSVNAPRVLDAPGSPNRPRVSVLMPTYGHAPFIRRAIESLRAQTLTDWELVIVDDASPDDTPSIVAPLLADQRLRYKRLPKNRGLGAALNQALVAARGRYVAYLPSDDVYYPDHLASLVDCLISHREAVAAYSGARHHYRRQADGQIEGLPLQLVQVMHRLTADLWVEREELVTDDLEAMFWCRLSRSGSFVGTGRVTSEWVDHPGQLHKLLQEPLGGLNIFRSKFNVRHPLRFHTTLGNSVDEVELYRRFRERADTPPAADGLKILLVGELAYNPERVLALEERGHRLYGLWTDAPYWFNTVGPLPFGHVQDLPRDRWVEYVREVKPDLIYALLNWQAIPFIHRVLNENPGLPFIWHFKEGPFICLQKGLWPQLVDLYSRADACIYSTPELREWTELMIPAAADRPGWVLDGDLPKRDWFTDDRSSRLSEEDGEIHTVVPGRPIGLHPELVEELAREGIHLHFYGNFIHGQWKNWIDKAMPIANGYLHLHGNVDQDRWVSEFSRYDAGWLHVFPSQNEGDLRRATWDDLNYPARIGPLAAAGLPMLQLDNPNSRVAAQELVREHELGLFFRDIPDLGQQLRNTTQLEQLRENVWRRRFRFTFDHHVDRLVGIFRQVIDSRDRAARPNVRRELAVSPGNGKPAAESEVLGA